MKLGVVLLAAGKSVRFGSNKLLADFCGQTMVCRMMDTAKALEAERLAAIVSCDEVAKLARDRGFEVIQNEAPELGQARSVVLGAAFMADMDAVLFLAGDMPLLTGESLRLLMTRFEASGKGIACLADETHRGNPAVFSRSYFPALLSLEGDRGAKRILRDNGADLLVVPCLYANELADADTPEMLERIQIKRTR